MSIQVIVDGNDISNYVTSVERRQSICNPIGEATIGISPNLPTRINTFEDVLIYENGIKVFTGYTTCVVKARLPIKATLTCSDVLIKAKETWIGDDYICNGESVKYWVRKFLKLSSLHNRSIEVGNAYPVYPGFGWGHMTAWEAIVQTLQMCPFQIFADRNGRVTLTRLDKSNPIKTINAYISYERTRNDSWLRNRAVVMGYDGLAADVYLPNPYLPDETRTVTVATGTIYNMSLAYEIAEELLWEFKNPWDVKVVTIPGDPSLEVGQAIHLVDSWSGYEDDCIIISLNSIYEGETYQTELSLDERCPKFWGWDNPPPLPPEHIYVYCSTWGHGVWVSIDCAKTWDSAGLSGKYIYAIEAVDNLKVWAAGTSGVYYTFTGGENWANQSMGDPADGGGLTEADLHWIGVASEHGRSARVYVLAIHEVLGMAWIYYTYNRGADWNSARIF